MCRVSPSWMLCWKGLVLGPRPPPPRHPGDVSCSLWPLFVISSPTARGHHIIKVKMTIYPTDVPQGTPGDPNAGPMGSLYQNLLEDAEADPSQAGLRAAQPVEDAGQWRAGFCRCSCLGADLKMAQESPRWREQTLHQVEEVRMFLRGYKCVCVCVCAHACPQACLCCFCVWVFMNARVYTIPVSQCIRVCMYRYVFVFLCVYVCMCVCVWVRVTMCRCMLVCWWACICVIVYTCVPLHK